jgi:hemerythrin-like metal-binding protein
MEGRDTFLRTAYSPLDDPHEKLDRRVRALASAVCSGRADDSRAHLRALVHGLGEHFAGEEELMRTHGWSQVARHAEAHARLLDRVNRFEARLAGRGLTPGFSSWALKELPDLLRYHTVRSDFGFAKFALDVAQDPGSLPSGRR